MRKRQCDGGELCGIRHDTVRYELYEYYLYICLCMYNVYCMSIYQAIQSRDHPTTTLNLPNSQSIVYHPYRRAQPLWFITLHLLNKQNILNLVIQNWGKYEGITKNLEVVKHRIDIQYYTTTNTSQSKIYLFVHNVENQIYVILILPLNCIHICSWTVCRLENYTRLQFVFRPFDYPLAREQVNLLVAYYVLNSIFFFFFWKISLQAHSN